MTPHLLEKNVLGVSNDRTSGPSAEMELLLRLTAHLLEQPHLEQAFRQVLADVCTARGWAFGEAWVEADEGQSLRCLAWHSNDPTKAEALGESVIRMKIRKGNGPAGQAWQTRKVAWFRDVADDPSFENMAAARQFGFKAGFSVPVLDGERVIAVLVLFLTRPADRDEREVVLLGSVAAQLGLFVRAKQTADLLQFREEQLANAQHLCRVGSWSWDLHTGIMQWSDQLYRNLGLLPQSEPASLPLFLELLQEEERAFVQHRVGQLRNGAPPLEFHRVRTRPRKGKSRVLELRAQFEKDAEGQVIRLLGTAQDVTPQVEAEEALQRQGALLEERVQQRTAALRAANERLEAEIVERRKAEATQERWTNLLREVLLCTDELISCATADSFYRRAVELPRERLGLERTGLLVAQGDQMVGSYGTDALGRTIDERHLVFGIPLDGPEQWALRLDAIREGGTRWFAKEVDVYPQYLGIELEGKPPGGGVVISPIVHEGKLLGFFSNDNALSGDALDPIQQEVLAVYCTLLASLMKRRSIALKFEEQRERLRRMVENMPVGAVYVESDGIRLNRYAEEIIGYSRTEVDTLEKWFQALYGERAEQVRALYEQDLRNGFAAPTTVQLRRKDGAQRHVVFSGVAREGIEIWLMQDVTDRVVAEEQVRKYQSQLRSLATEIGLAEERERRRVASGLHDQVVQMLAVAKIRLGSFQSGLEASEEQKSALQAIRDVLDSAIQETRALTFDLSPPVLYELGLGPALEWLAERTQRKHGLPCSVCREAASAPVPQNHAVVLFQAARELISNIVNHACATQVQIVFSADRQNVRLVVKDDGIGFDLALLGATTRQDDHHFGLFNIRERIRQMGGQVEIETQPGHGCRIELSIPAIQKQTEGQGEAP